MKLAGVQEAVLWLSSSGGLDLSWLQWDERHDGKRASQQERTVEGPASSVMLSRVPLITPQCFRMCGEHVSLLFIHILLYCRVKKKSWLLYESVTIERPAILNSRNTSTTLPYPIICLTFSYFYPAFFLLRRKWNWALDGLQFIGGSLYAVIYTIKWQHIETNLWLNEFESQRNSKAPPQAFSQ